MHKYKFMKDNGFNFFNLYMAIKSRMIYLLIIFFLEEKVDKPYILTKINDKSWQQMLLVQNYNHGPIAIVLSWHYLTND